jgi:hypothetical protein
MDSSLSRRSSVSCAGLGNKNQKRRLWSANHDVSKSLVSLRPVAALSHEELDESNAAPTACNPPIGGTRNARTLALLRQLEGRFQAGIDLRHRQCGKGANHTTDLRLCHREEVAASNGRTLIQSGLLTVRCRNVDEELRWLMDAAYVLRDERDDRIHEALVISVVLHNEHRADLRAAAVGLRVIQKDNVTSLHGLWSK